MSGIGSWRRWGHQKEYKKWFFGRVIKKENGCWEWPAKCQPSHTAFELTKGPIPPGKWVLHKCDNRQCVRPSHLFLGTQKDNQQDMARKGRQVFQRHPEKAPIGERNGRAVLMEKEVIEIRKLYGSATGRGKYHRPNHITQTELSIKYGVSQVKISQIVRRHYWRHV